MIQQTQHVADVVTEVPKSADIFRRYGIDFCCGGDIPIEEAARNNKRVDLDTLLQELNSIDQTEEPGTINVKYLDGPSLIQYIQARFHQPLKEEFKNLTPYVTKLAKVHGPNHPYLVELKSLYTQLKEALLGHIEEEDQEPFPQLRALSAGEEVAEPSTIINELVDEHKEVGQLLQDIRSITNDYQPPAEACGTWRLVYHRLEHLEHETHEHVHLENHVLFKKYQPLANE